MGAHAVIRWGILAVVMVIGNGCGTSRDGGPRGKPKAGAKEGEQSAQAPKPDRMAELRDFMVAEQIAARGVKDARVLAAMRTVPRHEFVPDIARSSAYDDRPLSIGHRQTISQPYIVAAMTELVQIDNKSRVLEIGTGSGYQAAVLAEIAAEVYSIEIVEPLGRRAAKVLERLGYKNINLRIGDGYKGWPEAAPFDAILVTAAPPSVPQPLVDQLAEGGHMVIPVGEIFQELRVLTKKGGKVIEETAFGVRFVPMTGRAQKDR